MSNAEHGIVTSTAYNARTGRVATINAGLGGGSGVQQDAYS